MQEIIVFGIAATALLYLFIKFIAKPKSHNCDKCNVTNNKDSEKH